ncbi:MAG TPA: hypothetical protein VNX21_05940 [Candidatus Thermoplasmatota archaeon]|nr:hypothetical protein [Candidatus Thermoplasmatota archaeon]
MTPTMGRGEAGREAIVHVGGLVVAGLACMWWVRAVARDALAPEWLDASLPLALAWAATCFTFAGMGMRAALAALRGRRRAQAREEPARS